MSTSRAYNLANTPEFREYEAALKLYKQQCSAFHLLRLKLSNSDVPEVRYIWLMTKEQFSRDCKLYERAKMKYTNFRAAQEVAKMGKTISITELAKSLGLKVSAGMSDLIEEQRKEQIKAQFKPGEIEELMKKAEALRAAHSDLYSDSAVPRPPEAECEQVEETQLREAEFAQHGSVQSVELSDPTKEF